MKLVAATLIALFPAFAAEMPKSQQGTWKYDAAKSQTTNPNGAPREATLTMTENGWTYLATERSGEKTDLRYDARTDTLSGNNDLRVRYEPTGNPNVSDLRFVDKKTGKEVERVMTVTVPGGKALTLYGSGTTDDGKGWWDSSCFTKVR